MWTATDIWNVSGLRLKADFFFRYSLKLYWFNISVAISVHLKLTVWVGTWYNFNTNNSCGASHASLNWVSILASIVMTLASGFFFFNSRFTCYWCHLPNSTTSSDVPARCSFCWVAQFLPWDLEFSLFNLLLFYFTFFLRSVCNLKRTIRSVISRITFKLEDCGIWNLVNWYVIEVSLEVATPVLLCLSFFLDNLKDEDIRLLQISQ